MKKDQNHIDDLFQSKLNERKFDIPQDFVDDLNQKLDQRKKNYFPWILFASIVVLGILSIVILSPEKGSLFNIDANAFIQLSLQQNQLEKEESSAALAELYNDKSKSPHTEVSEQDKSSVNTDKNQSGQNPIPSQNKTDQTQIPPKNNAHRAEKNDTETKQPADLNNSSMTSSTPDKKSSNNKAQSSKDEQIPTDDYSSEDGQNKSSDEKGSNKNHQQKNASTDSESSVDDNKTANKQNDVEHPFKDKTTEIYVSPSGDSIRIKDSIRYIDSVVVRDSIVIKDSIRYIDSTVTKEEPQKNFQMELQLFGGFEFSKPSYSPKGTLSNDQEKGIGAVNTGLLFNMYFKDITAGIGLEYQSTGEKYNYTLTSTNSYDSVIISGYDSIPIYDTNGTVVIGYQTTPIIDTLTVTDSTQSSNSGKNQYNWITVPIRFGYRFNIKSWAIIPRVGLNFHFGVANNNTNYLIPSTNALESVPTKSFALSYHFQLEIRKTFKHFHIFLRPHYNGMFTPTHETSSYTRKYSSFGGQIGLGIQF